MDKVQLAREIEHWQNGGTNFNSLLFTLIQKADHENTEKIRLGFPDHVDALCEWMNSDQPEAS